MNLSILSQSINPNFNGKLIPLNEYKGPILKLTKTDKAKIAQLQEKLNDADYELAKINDLYKKNYRNSSNRNYFEGIIGKLEATIDELKTAIKEIKINRIQKQRARQNKSTK